MIDLVIYDDADVRSLEGEPKMVAMHSEGLMISFAKYIVDA